MAVRYFCDRCGTEVKGPIGLDTVKVMFPSNDENGVIGQLCNSEDNRFNCMKALKEDFMKPPKKVQ